MLYRIEFTDYIYRPSGIIIYYVRIVKAHNLFIVKV